MKLLRSSRLPLLSLLLGGALLGGTLLAGCSGEEKIDPAAEEAMKKQRGPARPGGAPPGFPVAGEKPAPGSAPGVPSGQR